jgi:hypothetical protein
MSQGKEPKLDTQNDVIENIDNAFKDINLKLYPEKSPTSSSLESSTNSLNLNTPNNSIRSIQSSSTNSINSLPSLSTFLISEEPLTPVDITTFKFNELTGGETISASSLYCGDPKLALIQDIVLKGRNSNLQLPPIEDIAEYLPLIVHVLRSYGYESHGNVDMEYLTELENMVDAYKKLLNN